MTDEELQGHVDAIINGYSEGNTKSVHVKVHVDGKFVFYACSNIGGGGGGGIAKPEFVVIGGGGGGGFSSRLGKKGK